MKRVFFTVLFFSFFNGIYAQSVLVLAMKNKSNIVAKKPVKIYLGNDEFNTQEFYGYLGVLGTEFPKKDTTELKNLITKAKESEADLTEWTELELPNKILVEPKEFIKPKVGLTKIAWATKEEKKAIIKEIRKYNRNKVMWPNFPLYLSRPIYSESNHYALVALINGGSTGKVILYKKNAERWTEIADVYAWAY